MEDSKKVKKLLTVEDLIQFCEKNKFTTFDSKDYGYQLSVQIPSTFEVDENSSTQGLLRIKIKVAHTGVNRNKSHISKENMEKAMPSLKNRPVLANIHQLDNGEWDFRAHDFDIVTDKDGNQQFVYLEKQVGSFTEDEPYLEYDAERDVYFVIAYAVIPEDYTMAADILRTKNGTKNSCELCINTMSYNAQEKYLDLQDFYFAASTLLGSKENGEEIGEGMEGSRADILDFSKDNNSVMNYIKQDEQINSKLIDTLERLNTTLSEFNINKETQQAQNFSNNEKEGGIRSVKLEELLSKYNKTVDELDFETEGLSDEKLEAKFEEAFDNNSEREGVEDTEGADNGKGSEGEGTDATVVNNEENPVSEGEGDPETDPAESTGEFTKNPVNDNPENPKFSKTFELSMEDIRSALYQLLEPVEQANNDWYWIVQTYDNRFIYQGCMGNYYCQKYTKDGNNVAFDGERYPVFAEFVTESEKVELDKMRSNYSSIVEELNKYKEAEDIANKMSIFEDESYADYLETDGFKELMSEDTLKKFSKEELQDKVDLALAKLVKKNKAFSFGAEGKEKKVNKIGINSGFENDNDNNDPYGDYFKSLSSRY